MEFAADSEDASTPTGTLGIYGMVGVGFFWVSGGMFGECCMLCIAHGHLSHGG
jgi:hypothetical protein